MLCILRNEINKNVLAGNCKISPKQKFNIRKFFSFIFFKIHLIYIIALITYKEKNWNTQKLSFARKIPLLNPIVALLF